MRILKLVVAAAIAFGTMGALSVPAPGSTAEAQRHWRGDGHRHWRGDRHRGRHWRGHRGRHYGWRTRRVCRWVHRHGHRERVCRVVRGRY